MPAPEDKTAAELRHEVANPLGAILGEVQLALLDRDTIPPHLVETLERVERIALRIRGILQTKQKD